MMITTFVNTRGNGGYTIKTRTTTYFIQHEQDCVGSLQFVCNSLLEKQTNNTTLQLGNNI